MLLFSFWGKFQPGGGRGPCSFICSSASFPGCLGSPWPVGVGAKPELLILPRPCPAGFGGSLCPAGSRVRPERRKRDQGTRDGGAEAPGELRSTRPCHTAGAGLVAASPAGAPAPASVPAHTQSHDSHVHGPPLALHQELIFQEHPGGSRPPQGCPSQASRPARGTFVSPST